jgi:hypothetical protein
MEDIQGLLETKYNETYLYYSEYFATLDASGIASFMIGADDLLGSFYTSGGADFELDKQLYRTRLRGITQALLEHPTAERFIEDFKVLAKLAGIDEISPKPH